MNVYDEGYRAGLNGEDFVNPYEGHGGLGFEWEMGYYDGMSSNEFDVDEENCIYGEE